jgi:hypothetical protein
MDITDLHLELCRLQNLSESLLRSIQLRELEDVSPAPDVALAEFLSEEIAELADRVSSQLEIPALLPSDLLGND